MFAREGGFSSSRRVKADASSATTETSAPGGRFPPPSPVGWLVFKSVRRVMDFGYEARARDSDRFRGGGPREFRVTSSIACVGVLF